MFHMTSTAFCKLIAFVFGYTVFAAIWPVSAETISTGTGFAVTFDGVLVTNDHVIDGCRGLRARIQGAEWDYHEATVIARDRALDLAAIRLQPKVAPFPSKIRSLPRALLRKEPPIRVGEQAITYGFPLRGILAAGGNLTTGYVTALRGLKDNPNYMQISTPIQPGNSGGALLDISGNVIGVVKSSLDDLALMRATGSVPQNVNFAVELDALKRFLANSNISPIEEPSTAERPMTEIGSRAQLFTHVIECDDQPPPKVNRP
jgi:S1-C subfamily serine protease